MFSVRICGSVSYARYVTAWGLSRLSDLAVYADDLASTRNVTVTTPDGNSVSYDLYKAMREDSSQDNPLLVPGSEIVFNRATATVGIGGAVKRPGAYQPLGGESLYDMIDRYCNGLLNSADRQRITVSNYAGGSYYFEDGIFNVAQNDRYNAQMNYQRFNFRTNVDQGTSTGAPEGRPVHPRRDGPAADP